jgi:hypothetical protein
VYELDVVQRERVVIDLEAQFDAALYIRKADCSDDSAEVDCNDDYNGENNHSRLEDTLEPGKYFVFVDGANRDAGRFKMTVSISDAVALSDGCRRAQPLLGGAVVSASTATSIDTARAACGAGAEGADAPWRMVLAAPSRVRLIERSDEFVPVLHVRRACLFEESELACGDGGPSPNEVVISQLFDAGSYTVFADARDLGAKGVYSLGLDTVPREGTGVSGDSCADAIPLAVRPTSGAALTTVSVSGDTFPARDDVSGSCGGKGAPDVVYRLDVDRRSHLSAQLASEDAPHVLVGWKGCGDRAREFGCGRTLDAVLEPGSYFLAVDGFEPDSFGRFELDVSTQDVSGQANACASAPQLVRGRNAGTLGGSPARFAQGCLADPAADRVYKLVLGAPEEVNLALGKTTFDAGLSLRKTCPDGPGGTGATEIQCQSGHPIAQTLEAGTYWVVVSGSPGRRGGSYVLSYGGGPMTEDEEQSSRRRMMMNQIP